MKISILNYSDSTGGASRAAYRIHQALLMNGVDSRMHVNEANMGDWTVDGPENKRQQLQNILRTSIGGLFNRLQSTGNPILHSVALLPSKWPNKLNASDSDLVNLVWVNGETLSIRDVSRINKPVVWTLQDMWAFCGAEHISTDQRYIEGYLKSNRPPHESGIDINRLTWLRKSRAWKTPMHLVVPSYWMSTCVQQSALMRDWPVSIIANPIDTERWYPLEKKLARQLMQLPDDVPLLLFGTSGANDARHKGFDLLLSALQLLRGQIDLHLVIFGQLAPQKTPDFGFPVHYVGHLHDDLSMQVLYSAVNIVAIPSRIDNLPNVGLEAISCGTPVVAFDTCGLPDIVQHQETGYLAKAFKTEDLANGVLWILSDQQRYEQLCRKARSDAEKRFSYHVIARKYQSVYELVFK